MGCFKVLIKWDILVSFVKGLETQLVLYALSTFLEFYGCTMYNAIVVQPSFSARVRLYCLLAVFEKTITAEMKPIAPLQ